MIRSFSHLSLLLLLVWLCWQPAVTHAAAVLAIQPLTWNVIGLDSNDVNVGPNIFPVGARVCNTGDTTATNVRSTFTWDSANPYINLDGLTALSASSLAAGACRDFYYNVVITRNPAAYLTARSYHISASADGVSAVSTPQPRELYVEKLISQFRNSVNSITGPTTLVVGQTYQFVVDSNTAPGGYEQLESFLNFPNDMFEIIAINTTYATPPGATTDRMYADACGWDNNPTSPTYRTCVGPPNYAGGKAGGSILTTYTVRVIAPGTATLSTLIYDFSGSSYHYNTDFNQAPNIITVVAVDPTPIPTATVVPTAIIPTATPVPGQPTATPVPGQPTATPVPGQPTPVPTQPPSNERADVTIQKAVSGPVPVGEVVEFTLTVSNIGTGPATDVVVTDNLPDFLELWSATPSRGIVSIAGNRLTVTIGTVKPGETITISVIARVMRAVAPPNNTNTAEVSTSSPTDDPANNRSSAVITVGLAPTATPNPPSGGPGTTPGNQATPTPTAKGGGATATPTPARPARLPDTGADDSTLELLLTFIVALVFVGMVLHRRALF